MKELLGAGIVFVVLAVALMIGGAMIAITENITLTIAPTSTLISTLATNAGTALTTLTSMLPIVALALVGGLAIFYLLAFMGRSAA